MADPHKTIVVTNDQSDLMLLHHRHPGAQTIWISCILVTKQGRVSENPSMKRVAEAGREEPRRCAEFDLDRGEPG